MNFKSLTLIFILVSFLEANYTFESNKECKECHPTIYKEHQNTMHNKSTIFKDPIHKAVWDKHPMNLQKGKYKCAKCHTPGADNLEQLLGKGTKGVPDLLNPTHTEGISCAYCHRIQSVKPGMMANINMISAEAKDYFGGMDKPLRNKFHYQAKNENFTNGNVCMGCHSHKKNKNKFDVCETANSSVNEKDNCITCHMPKVAGSISNKDDSPTHSYHGFPGANSGQEMLSKYVEVKFIQKNDGFDISIYNQSPHDLMLHPLRLTQLHVSIQNDKNVHIFEPKSFVRVIGKDSKPTAPWLANAIVKNTMIKPRETRIVHYTKALTPNDKVKVVLGYYLVNPAILKKFSLENDEKVKKFHILKEVMFEIK